MRAQAEAATKPLPPVAARYHQLPPLPPSTARTAPSSGYRRNRGRVGRVDRGLQFLRDESMRSRAGVDAVAAERQSEGVGVARRERGRSTEVRKGRHLRLNL